MEYVLAYNSSTSEPPLFNDNANETVYARKAFFDISPLEDEEGSNYFDVSSSSSSPPQTSSLNDSMLAGFGNATAAAADPTADPDEARVRMEAYYGLLSATGILIALSNGIIVALAIGILRRTTVHGVHKAQYVYIASLAGSDFLVGMVIFFIHLSRVQHNMCLCRLKISFAVTSGMASIFHTLLVAADRYFYIMHGMLYLREMRRLRVFAATATAWLLSFAIGFVPLALYYDQDSRVPADVTVRCFYVEIVSPAYAITLNALYVFVGLIPTVALYVTIVRTAFRQRAAVEALATPTPTPPPSATSNVNPIAINSRRTTPTTLLRRPSQLFRAEQRAVTAILLLIISFALCWIPHTAATLAYEFGVCGAAGCPKLAEYITTIFFFLGVLNSLLNPIIYAWGFKEFRTYVVKLCKAWCRCKKPSLFDGSQVYQL